MHLIILSSIPGASPSGEDGDDPGHDDDDEDEDVGSDFDEEAEEMAATDDAVGFYDPNEDEGEESKDLENDPKVAVEDAPPKAGFSGFDQFKIHSHLQVNPSDCNNTSIFFGQVMPAKADESVSTRPSVAYK